MCDISPSTESHHAILVRGLTTIAAQSCRCGDTYDRRSLAACPSCATPNAVARGAAYLPAETRAGVYSGAFETRANGVPEPLPTPYRRRLV